MTAVDLSQLAVRRDEPSAGPRRRHLLTRFVLPAVVLLGFGSLAVWAARDSLLAARAVTVLPVLTTRAEIEQAGQPLFQAAGWVEPRPAPTVVAALTEGVVEELLVVENQEVKAQQPVARLIERDAQLVVASAKAEVQLRQAELDVARAAASAARINLEQPVQLQAGLGEADAALARAELELGNLPAQARTARARLELARQQHLIKKQAHESGGLALTGLQQAANELEAAAAQVQELAAREPRLKREIAAQAQRRDALRRRLELKIDEQHAVARTEAQVRAATAQLAQAQVNLDRAELQQERTLVRSATAGRVLALVARRGARVMGLASGAQHDASTVITLYDPTSLQVRADVRFEDLQRVRPGQPVRIESPALPAPLQGQVLFTTGQADIQKNTVQVKVSLPPEASLLRPDMLVQTTFLAPKTTTPTAPSERLRLLIPRQLVESGEGGAAVWIVDPRGQVARRRRVQLGSGSGELVEVVAGLTAGDRLIGGGREGLSEGQRVSVTGEDATLGLGSLGGKTAPHSPKRHGATP